LILFGTDGIRGRWGEAPLCKSTVVDLARALMNKYEGGIAVLQDTRESGKEISEILLSTLGGRGIYLGVLPTPAMSVALESGVATVGIAVTASHNPWRDNGLKVIGPNGYKLTVEQERSLEELMLSSDVVDSQPPGVYSKYDGESLYVNRIVSMFEEGALSGLKVVVDPANGAAFRTAPEIMRRLGADVTEVHNSPDGRNINYHCGALHPEVVGGYVSSLGCDVGIALDGDADRCMVVDMVGELIPGDAALYLLSKGLRGDDEGVVGTLMSNSSLESSVLAAGLGFVRAPVGDRNISREMRRTGWSLGGEPSGHVLMSSGLPTGDGLVTAINLIIGGVDFKARLDGWCLAPQENRSVRVKTKPPLESLAGLQGVVFKAKSAGVQRVLLRYSGTEPLLRILVEASDSELAKIWADQLVEIAEKSI